MKRMRYWMSLGVAIAALASMGAEECSSEVEEVPAGADPLSWNVIERTDFAESFPAQDRQVIRTDAVWQRVWTRISGEETPTPEVDFEQYMVVIAAMGSRDTGGHSISVQGVFETDYAVYVEIRTRSPGPECVTPPVLTSPLIAIQVPRRNKPVFWVEQSQTESC